MFQFGTMNGQGEALKTTLQVRNRDLVTMKVINIRATHTFGN